MCNLVKNSRLLLSATLQGKKILSRASEVGSPTNHLGSRQRQDTGPGILWSINRWTRPDRAKPPKIEKERTLH